MRDIQLVLDRWGSWANAEGDSVGWPFIGAGFKGLLPPTGKSFDLCTDGDGLIVDAAVGMLKKVKREEEYDLIMAHYRYKVSKSAIARKLKWSEGQVRNKLMIAETFVDACIAMTGARLELDEWLQKKVIKKVA